MKARPSAKKKLSITFKHVEATDDNSFESLLRAFAQEDFDLIIDIGFVQEEPLVLGRPKRLVGTVRDD
jgi:basic membrane lipoprotein Med (substrate-binding protein (PBP1-ABC) superfamily)